MKLNAGFVLVKKIRTGLTHETLSTFAFWQSVIGFWEDDEGKRLQPRLQVLDLETMELSIIFVNLLFYILDVYICIYLTITTFFVFVLTEVT